MFDVKRFLEDYSIEFWESGPNTHEGWINISCCFCEDTHNHLGLNLYERYGNCWKCGGHSLDNILKELTNKNWHEIKEIKAEYDTIYHSLITHTDRKIKKYFSLIDSIKPSIVNDKNINLKKYLKKRGFSKPEKIIKKYNIKEIDKYGPYSYRILFPVYFNNNIVSFQTRDYTEKQKIRYKACSNKNEVMNIKHTLYNFDNANENYVIVTEGIFDCIKLGDNAVSIYGVQYTQKQVLLLAENYKMIYILFDNDDAGKKASIKLSEDLTILGADTEIISLDKNYHDIGELSEKEAEKLKKLLLS